jgi:hypothetical protein
MKTIHTTLSTIKRGLADMNRGQRRLVEITTGIRQF